jgi:hypothetical protein
MKAQKRQLEDQMNGAKREAEAAVRDLNATRQELEDAKQTLASSEQRLRLGASAQEQVRTFRQGRQRHVMLRLRDARTRRRRAAMVSPPSHIPTCRHPPGACAKG